MAHYTSGPATGVRPGGTPSGLPARTGMLNFLNVLVLLGSIAIILSLSLEVFCDPGRYSGLYMQVQFWVCVIFLVDFFYRLRLSPRKGRFVLANLLFLLVSIPYLNIVNWFDLHVSQELYYWLRMVPLIRGGYGLAIMVGWVTRSRATSLMVSYVLMIFALTYFTSLVFYTLEKPVNPGVDTFGNSLWWAFMNVTTVGANVFAKTATGKVLTVVLAASGMMLFPIFTAYITTKVQDRRDREKNGDRTLLP